MPPSSSSRPSGANSEKYGSVPHPVNIRPSGSSCALPIASATIRHPGCTNALVSVTCRALVSTARITDRDCFSSAGKAPLSKTVSTPSPRAPDIVLPEEPGPGPHREVGFLAVHPPDDLAGLPADLIHGPCVPRRDQQVP